MNEILLIFLDVVFFVLFYLIIDYFEKVRKHKLQTKLSYYGAEFKMFFFHFIRFVKYADEPEENYINAYLQFLSSHYPQETIEIIENIVKKYLKDDINVERAVLKSDWNQHNNKIRIINFLFKMAAADGRISIKELAYIESVYKLLKISDNVYFRIKSYYIQEEEAKSDSSFTDIFIDRKTLLSEAFQILEIDENSDTDTIKKAYRTLVKISHPDKFATQGDVEIKKAEQKFQILTEAYEYIKTVRKIN
jgi:DnaJ-domain-containing protein 1